MSDKTREEFEAWALSEGYINLKRNSDDSYTFTSANMAWIGWQASRAVLAQEAGKCEPVAKMHSGMEGDCCIWFSRPADGTFLYTSPPAPVSTDMIRLLTRARIYARGEFRDEIDACLAGQPAPVSVLLPECKPEVYAWGHDMGGNYDEGQADGWNACLDKVKELNQ